MLLASRVLTQLGGKSLQKLKESQIKDGIDQAMKSFSHTETRLLEAVRGVSQWEELSSFFSNPDSNWAKENLVIWAPHSYKLDFMAICDSSGKILFKWGSDERNRKLLPISTLTDSVQSGWVATPRNLYLLANSNIVDGDQHLGTLIFGRKLTHRMLLEMRINEHSDLLVYYGSRLIATTDTTSSLPYVDPGVIFTEMISRNGIYIYEDPETKRAIGFRGLKNLQGEEIAAIGWSSTHFPTRFIEEAIDNIFIYFGIPLLALVLLSALILGLWIEKPIRKLSKTMEDIRTTGDLSRRAPVTGGGEISSMSHSFNQMLEQLSRQRDELITFRTMVQTMKEGVMIEDLNHQILYLNPRLEEMTGIRGIENMKSSDFIQFVRAIETDNDSSGGDRGFISEEVEWTKSDGARIQAIRSSINLKDQNGENTGILSTFVDITERNDLEIELINASRMAFLGLYSQGIIHNLNGPLNSIVGFSSLLLRENPRAEIPQRIHQDAQRLSDQVATLGRQWLRTSRSSEGYININEILEEEAKFLEANLFYKHNVEKVFDLDPDLPPIKGIYGDFSQAFLNILVNSTDALTESSQHMLKISTKYVESEIEVIIEDSGIGIPPNNLEKIFLPFFSTKRRNRDEGMTSGAGLGLPIARKVLEKYDVLFTIESQLGKGTRVILRIPIIEKEHSLAEEQINKVYA